ncbi:hypothetical protein [Paenibacillus piscarius]|uniref:hypothetical protein n=1 Tax=Paenibacillus piscarius TaxID=1089681 RepID=UPI001EE82A61|nr:hypothetical protein [Paenibacillus piscarius]
MKKESHAANTTLGEVSTFKGGGSVIGLGRNRPLPLTRAAYFFMEELSNAIMNMPNMNNRDCEWNTQTESLTKPKSRLPHLPLGFFYRLGNYYFRAMWISVLEHRRRLYSGMTSLFTEHNGLPVVIWAGGGYGRKTDHIRCSGGTMSGYGRKTDHIGDAAGLMFMPLTPLWKFILPS